MPINLLHHHAEEDHAIAYLLHQETEHHCELDDQFCQPNTLHACNHDTHIAKPIGHCFVCEFHFIKQLEAELAQIKLIQPSERLTYLSFNSDALQRAIVRISNKGPPLFFG